MHVAVIGWYSLKETTKESVQFFKTAEECHSYVERTQKLMKKYPHYKWLYTMVMDEESYFERVEE